MLEPTASCHTVSVTRLLGHEVTCILPDVNVVQSRSACSASNNCGLVTVGELRTTLCTTRSVP